MIPSDFSERSCVLVDLDNTLFDHRYSLRQGIAAEQERFPESLGQHDLDELAAAHNRALEIAYRAGMRDGVPAADMAELRTEIFLDSLGLEGEIDPRPLAEIYEEAYLSDRRATGGSIELLARLKDAGWDTVIVSDGKRQTQLEKATVIGVWPLVDAMITSEDAGASKPDPRLFSLAADACGASLDRAVMIGDDLARDVLGSLAAGAAAIFYAPGGAPEDVTEQHEAPTITHMHEAMALLNVTPPAFEDGAFWFGLDLITAPRHCSSYTREEALVLWGHLERAAGALQDEAWEVVLAELAGGLGIVVGGARILDPARVVVRLPEFAAPGQAAEGGASAEVRLFSVRAECAPLKTLSPAAAAILDEMRACCQEIARDHPRAAARALRRAALLSADQAGVADQVQIEGEEIEAT